MTWLWIIGALTAWFVLAAPCAVVIGRGIRPADRGVDGYARLTTADLPASFVARGLAGR